MLLLASFTVGALVGAAALAGVAWLVLRALRKARASRSRQHHHIAIWPYRTGVPSTWRN